MLNFKIALRISGGNLGKRVNRCSSACDWLGDAVVFVGMEEVDESTVSLVSGSCVGFLLDCLRLAVIFAGLGAHTDLPDRVCRIR